MQCSLNTTTVQDLCQREFKKAAGPCTLRSGCRTRGPPVAGAGVVVRWPKAECSVVCTREEEAREIQPRLGTRNVGGVAACGLIHRPYRRRWRFRWRTR